MSATDARIASLNAQRVSLAAGVAASEASCRQLQGRGDTLASELTEAVNLKYRLLLATTRLQRTAKRYEDVESGRYRPAVEDSSQVSAAVCCVRMPCLQLRGRRFGTPSQTLEPNLTATCA